MTISQASKEKAMSDALVLLKREYYNEGKEAQAQAVSGVIDDLSKYPDSLARLYDIIEKARA